MLKRSLVLGLWCLLLLGGFLSLGQYSFRPAKTQTAETRWPARSAWKRSGTLPTLIVFLHPQCGCSKATVAEIETMLPKIAGKMQVILSFYQPSQKPLEWTQSRLWSSVQTWPGIEIKMDHDGKQSESFRANVSGETFLYSADGELLFHGGLTPSRGHQGDTIGRQIVLAKAEGKSLAYSDSKVFGCALRDGTLAALPEDN